MLLPPERIVLFTDGIGVRVGLGMMKAVLFKFCRNYRSMSPEGFSAER